MNDDILIWRVQVRVKIETQQLQVITGKVSVELRKTKKSEKQNRVDGSYTVSNPQSERPQRPLLLPQPAPPHTHLLPAV